MTAFCCSVSMNPCKSFSCCSFGSTSSMIVAPQRCTAGTGLGLGLQCASVA